MGLGLWGVGGRVAVSDPPTPLSPQTGQVLEKGPVLRLHNLQRDAGGGYRCVASVPSVPGLNRTQLVRVAIFGEALWAETGRPGKLPPRLGGFELFEDERPPAAPGCSGGEGDAGQRSWPPHPSPSLSKGPRG